MIGAIEKLIGFTTVALMGLWFQHPLTVRAELQKVQYKILKEISRTDNWGSPLIWKANLKTHKIRSSR